MSESKLKDGYLDAYCVVALAIKRLQKGRANQNGRDQARRVQRYLRRRIADVVDHTRAADKRWDWE